MQVDVQSFFDEPTNTVSYLVADPITRHAVVIDPLLDYDHRSGVIDVKSADAMLASIQTRGLHLDFILETHAHADHLSAADYLKRRTGAPVATGEHIGDVQKIFSRIFNLEDVSGTGREFDVLLRDNDRFDVGSIAATVLHTPGHTPSCVSYLIGDALFVGDTLFMPDYGTARTDFPGGDARTLYRSVRRLLALPDTTRMFLCHDYKSPQRDQFVWETTVRAQRESNVHINEHITEDAFVAARTAKDATLTTPALLLPAVQINICAGRLPKPDSNGVRYLRIPLQGDFAQS